MNKLLDVSGLHTCFRSEDELITIVDGYPWSCGPGKSSVWWENRGAANR